MLDSRCISTIIALSICTSALAAPNSSAPSAGGTATSPASTAAPAAPLVPPDPNTVAVVNGEKISRDELTEAVMRASGPAMLDRIIQEKILEQSAKKEGITITAADIDRAEAAFKRTAPSQQVWDDYVKRVGEQRIREEVLRPQVIQTKLGERLVKIDPSDLDEVQASHILIRSTANDDAAAKAKADKVMAEVKAPGADFAALAKKYSDDPGSAQKGGDLGFFGRGRMVKPFEDAAFAAKIGDIVGPIKSPFGYHIIKITGRKPASSLPPDELDQKKTQLIQQRSQEAIQLWIQRQRQQAKIDKFYPPAQ